MKAFPALRMLCLAAAALLVSCGDQSLFMSLSGTSTDVRLATVNDGEIVSRGAAVPLLVSIDDPARQKDAEIEVTLTAPSGDVVAHDRSPVVLDQQTSITLPADLAPGLYRMDIVVWSGADALSRRTISFFVAGEGWRIAGITSFPPLIATRSTVMLKADLQAPPGADPWMRWTWKGKVIARGARSAGYEQVLWTAPAEEGVYRITLEVFPASPAAGTDFPFTSSLSLSTDVFVTKGRPPRAGDLAPESSYLALLHLDADLADAGTAAHRADPAPAQAIGSPAVVSQADGFGYRLDGTSGIELPWIPVPLTEAGALRPFTVSLGVSLDAPDAGGTLLRMRAADGAFSLEITVDPARAAPRALLRAPGAADLEVPWNGPALAAKTRVLLSLSIVPDATSVGAQWFLDGVQVSAARGPFAVKVLGTRGTFTLGGPGGFSGIVDEAGVYVVDGAGRPSTDPDLFARAMLAARDGSLVFADGFDGPYVGSGLSPAGDVSQAGGRLALAKGASITLPAVAGDGSALALAASLDPDSPREAVITAAWEGSADVAARAVVTAGPEGLQVGVPADGRKLTLGSGADAKGVDLAAAPSADAKLRLTIGATEEARAPLLLEQVLVTRERQ